MRFRPHLPRWSSLRLRTKGLIVVALPILPLASFWLILVISLVRRPAPANTAGRSLEVQAGLGRVISGLLDAEAAGWDVLLTRRDGALARFRTARTGLPVFVTEVRSRLLDDAARASADRLGELVEREMSSLEALVRDGSSSRLDVASLAIDSGTAAVHEARGLARDIQNRQTALTTARAEVAQRRARAWLLALCAGSVIFVGGGFGAALSLANGMRRRIEAMTRDADRLARSEALDDGGTALMSQPAAGDEISRLSHRLREVSQLLATHAAGQKAMVAQLERTNQELESFSYSVSHDLRAPLRAIDGFSQVIEEDESDKLSGSSRDALRRVRAAARRMGALIDDLLGLARLSRTELRREPLDITSMAAGIIAELDTPASARHISTTVEPGLHATGDLRLVRIALQNLIGNAWKYTSTASCARVEIGASRKGAAQVFHVRDNGIGFDMAHAARLFGAFQRLHNDPAFEGSGVGLATVQRIVHRHGGRIWAEAQIASGATFYFTLEPEEGQQP